MPRNPRGPDGRFLSIATPNPVRMSCTNTTEITTMSTTNTNTAPVFASILASVEAGLSDRMIALVDERIGTVVREETAFHVAMRIPEAVANADLNTTLRDQAAAAATGFAREFMEAEVPVMREIVVEYASSSLRMDTIRDMAVGRVAERVMGEPLDGVYKAIAENVISNYFYDGSSRIERLMDRVVENVTHAVVRDNRDIIMTNVAMIIADRLTAEAATRLFGPADVTTASATPDAEARV